MQDLLLAIGGFIGALIAAAVAIISAGKEDQKLRRTLITFAVAGLVVSAVCVIVQYFSAKDADKKRDDALGELKKTHSDLNKTKDELDKANGVLNTASIGIDELAQLNRLSSGTFYVRLSTDTNACLPCNRARKIDHQFPGAISNQGIRVLNAGRETYQLIFGKSLSLASAGVYQRLAIDHELGSGRPLIESETGHEVIVDCSSKCPLHPPQ